MYRRRIASCDVESSNCLAVPLHLVQNILPSAPVLFILHVESGNGQVPAPSFSRHLGPSGLGDAPAQTRCGLEILEPFCFKNEEKGVSQATSTPLLQNFVAKMSFLVRPKKMHGGICKGVLKVGPGEAQKGLNSEAQKNAQRHL